MKIVTYAKMPKKYFDICEARRCQEGAKHLFIIRTKDREGRNVADEYALCDKHFKQWVQEAMKITENEDAK